MYAMLQFTLCVQMKGNKPDFHDAMAPDQSEQFYKDFLQKMRTTYAEDKIKGCHIIFCQICMILLTVQHVSTYYNWLHL